MQHHKVKLRHQTEGCYNNLVSCILFPVLHQNNTKSAWNSHTSGTFFFKNVSCGSIYAIRNHAGILHLNLNEPGDSVKPHASVSSADLTLLLVSSPLSPSQLWAPYLGLFSPLGGSIELGKPVQWAHRGHLLLQNGNSGEVQYLHLLHPLHLAELV